MNVGLHWTLDGVEVGQFKGLSEERVAKLEFQGDWNGVKVFTSRDCPRGFLELWLNGERLAVVHGIGAPPSE